MSKITQHIYGRGYYLTVSNEGAYQVRMPEDEGFGTLGRSKGLEWSVMKVLQNTPEYDLEDQASGTDVSRLFLYRNFSENPEFSVIGMGTLLATGNVANFRKQAMIHSLVMSEDDLNRFLVSEDAYKVFDRSFANGFCFKDIYVKSGKSEGRVLSAMDFEIEDLDRLPFYEAVEEPLDEWTVPINEAPVRKLINAILEGRFVAVKTAFNSGDVDLIARTILKRLFRLLPPEIRMTMTFNTCVCGNAPHQQCKLAFCTVHDYDRLYASVGTVEHIDLMNPDDDISGNLSDPYTYAYVSALAKACTDPYGPEYNLFMEEKNGIRAYEHTVEREMGECTCSIDLLKRYYYTLAMCRQDYPLDDVSAEDLCDRLVKAYSALDALYSVSVGEGRLSAQVYSAVTNELLERICDVNRPRANNIILYSDRKMLAQLRRQLNDRVNRKVSDVFERAVSLTALTKQIETVGFSGGKMQNGIQDLLAILEYAIARYEDGPQSPDNEKPGYAESEKYMGYMLANKAAAYPYIKASDCNDECFDSAIPAAAAKLLRLTNNACGGRKNVVSKSTGTPFERLYYAMLSECLEKNDARGIDADRLCSNALEILPDVDMRSGNWVNNVPDPINAANIAGIQKLNSRFHSEIIRSILEYLRSQKLNNEYLKAQYALFGATMQLGTGYIAEQRRQLAGYLANAVSSDVADGRRDTQLLATALRMLEEKALSDKCKSPLREFSGGMLVVLVAMLLQPEYKEYRRTLIPVYACVFGELLDKEIVDFSSTADVINNLVSTAEEDAQIEDLSLFNLCSADSRSIAAPYRHRSDLFRRDAFVRSAEELIETDHNAHPALRKIMDFCHKRGYSRYPVYKSVDVGGKVKKADFSDITEDINRMLGFGDDRTAITDSLLGRYKDEAIRRIDNVKSYRCDQFTPFVSGEVYLKLMQPCSAECEKIMQSFRTKVDEIYEHLNRVMSSDDTPVDKMTRCIVFAGYTADVLAGMTDGNGDIHGSFHARIKSAETKWIGNINQMIVDKWGEKDNALVRCTSMISAIYAQYCRDVSNAARLSAADRDSAGKILARCSDFVDSVDIALYRNQSLWNGESDRAGIVLAGVLNANVQNNAALYLPRTYSCLLDRTFADVCEAAQIYGKAKEKDSDRNANLVRGAEKLKKVLGGNLSRKCLNNCCSEEYVHSLRVPAVDGKAKEFGTVSRGDNGKRYLGQNYCYRADCILKGISDRVAGLKRKRFAGFALPLLLLAVLALTALFLTLGNTSHGKINDYLKNNRFFSACMAHMASGSDISAGDVLVVDVSATDISVVDISAAGISAAGISASDIPSGEVTADNVTSGGDVASGSDAVRGGYQAAHTPMHTSAM